MKSCRERERKKKEEERERETERERKKDKQRERGKERETERERKGAERKREGERERKRDRGRDKQRVCYQRIEREAESSGDTDRKNKIEKTMWGLKDSNEKYLENYNATELVRLKAEVKMPREAQDK